MYASDTPKNRYISRLRPENGMAIQLYGYIHNHKAEWQFITVLSVSSKFEMTAYCETFDYFDCKDGCVWEQRSEPNAVACV